LFPFTDRFLSNEANVEFLKTTMMGPNAMRLAEALASHLQIDEETRILDLGCGRGLSTLLLAQKYGASVFAADLWISPTENYKRFQALGIADHVVPIFTDATKGLPFANGYFDLLFTVDSYHYFGDTPEMLPSLVPFIKKGGFIAAVVPGLRYEFGKNVPVEMQPVWNSEMERTLHSLGWWKELWGRENGIEIIDCREMSCCKQAWDEWLTAYPPEAAHDVKMMEAEGGKYFNLVQLIARVY